VDISPTILFDPERYSIRFLGAPMGEEGRTLLEAVVLIGLRSSNLSEQSLKMMEKIDSPRMVKVFSSPTCPYCPQQAVSGLKAAIAKPELISLEIVDIQANPNLADLYSAHSVPQTFANDTLIAQGAQPEELFVLSLQKMEAQTVFIPDIDTELVENDLVIVGGGSRAHRGYLCGSQWAQHSGGGTRHSRGPGGNNTLGGKLPRFHPGGRQGFG
jgi:thioredoxin reductase (NADPH)